MASGPIGERTARRSRHADVIVDVRPGHNDCGIATFAFRPLERRVKQRKPGTARKPPEPTNSHAEIANWIRSQMPALSPIVAAVDDLIREAIPDLQYAIKWGKAYYGLPDRGWIIEMVAYDVSVNVVFLGGADFDSPPPLGDSDRSRYVKLTTLDEVSRPEMRGWIEQAARTAGWR